MIHNDNDAQNCKVCHAEPKLLEEPGCYIPGGWLSFGCVACNATVSLNLADPKYTEKLEGKDLEHRKLAAIGYLTRQWNLFFSAKDMGWQYGMNKEHYGHFSSNGSIFVGTKCDLTGLNRVFRSEELTEHQWLSDVMEFTAWHRTCIWENLNGFAGYDLSRNIVIGTLDSDGLSHVRDLFNEQDDWVEQMLALEIPGEVGRRVIEVADNIVEPVVAASDNLPEGYPDDASDTEFSEPCPDHLIEVQITVEDTVEGKTIENEDLSRTLRTNRLLFLASIFAGYSGHRSVVVDRLRAIEAWTSVGLPEPEQERFFAGVARTVPTSITDKTLWPYAVLKSDVETYPWMLGLCEHMVKLNGTRNATRIRLEFIDEHDNKHEYYNGFIHSVADVEIGHEGVSTAQCLIYIEEVDRPHKEYEVVCDENNNPPEAMAEGKLVLDVYLETKGKVS